MLLCQFREITELNDVGIMGGDFDTSAYRERGKAELNRRSMGRDAAHLSARFGSNVWPD